MAREKFPSDDVERLMLRFPSGMRDRLKAEAEVNNRSLNAEIINRLENSLDVSFFDRPTLTDNAKQLLDRAGIVFAYAVIDDMLKFFEFDIKDVPNHLLQNIKTLRFIRDQITHGNFHADLSHFEDQDKSQT